MLIGLPTMIVMMLIYLLLPSKQKNYVIKALSYRDRRMKATNEAISNIKIVKLKA